MRASPLGATLAYVAILLAFVVGVILVTAPSSAPVYPSGPGTSTTTTPALSGAPSNGLLAAPSPGGVSRVDTGSAPTPRPSGGIGQPATGRNSHPPAPDSLRGQATWYRYHPGQAAAGPRLRAYLGHDWRGTTVRVWAAPRYVNVVLTDWCLCTGGDRLIDLDIRSFAALASPSRGVINVTVEVP